MREALINILSFALFAPAVCFTLYSFKAYERDIPERWRARDRDLGREGDWDWLDVCAQRAFAARVVVVGMVLSIASAFFLDIMVKPLFGALFGVLCGAALSSGKRDAA